MSSAFPRDKSFEIFNRVIQSGSSVEGEEYVTDTVDWCRRDVGVLLVNAAQWSIAHV